MLLFIGISSFVGKNFLASYQGNLIGTYNKSNMIKMENKGASFVKLDLADYNQVYNLFKDNNIDEVVLAAAVIRTKNKKAFYDTNVAGVSNVIKAMKIFGSKRIVYLSTVILYNKEMVWGEYGQTKNLAEQLIIKSNLDYVILRPAEIYGPDEKEGLGKLINLIRKFRIIPIINDGKNFLTPVHVGDVCEIIKICLAQKIYDKNIYCLAGGQKISLREFIVAVAEELDKKIVLLDIPLGWLNFISVFFPAIIDREQILRAANTLSFNPQETEAKFDFKFRRIDLSYLNCKN